MLLSPPSSLLADASSRKPNIVVILTDVNPWSSANTVNDPNNTASVFSVRDAVPISTTGKRFLRLRFTLLP